MTKSYRNELKFKGYLILTKWILYEKCIKMRKIIYKTPQKKNFNTTMHVNVI